MDTSTFASPFKPAHAKHDTLNTIGSITSLEPYSNKDTMNSIDRIKQLDIEEA